MPGRRASDARSPHPSPAPKATINKQNTPPDKNRRGVFQNFICARAYCAGTGSAAGAGADSAAGVALSAWTAGAAAPASPNVPGNVGATPVQSALGRPAGERCGAPPRRAPASPTGPRAIKDVPRDRVKVNERTTC
jgi:hypothetical protein